MIIEFDMYYSGPFIKKIMNSKDNLYWTHNVKYLKNIGGGGLQVPAVMMQGIAIGYHEDRLLPRVMGDMKETARPGAGEMGNPTRRGIGKNPQGSRRRAGDPQGPLERGRGRAGYSAREGLRRRPSGNGGAGSRGSRTYHDNRGSGVGGVWCSVGMRERGIPAVAEALCEEDQAGRWLGGALAAGASAGRWGGVVLVLDRDEGAGDPGGGRSTL